MSLVDQGRKAATRAAAGVLAASKAGVRLAARFRAGEIGVDTGEDAAYRNARRSARREIGRVNIPVAGNTGVGKSSLINAVFGDDVAPASAGRPVTQGLHPYKAPNAPLNLWDSRGFEAGGDEAVKLVEAKIAELRSKDDASEQIHIAWLCIAAMSSRVEPVHEDSCACLRNSASRASSCSRGRSSRCRPTSNAARFLVSRESNYWRRRNRA